MAIVFATVPMTAISRVFLIAKGRRIFNKIAFRVTEKFLCGLFFAGQPTNYEYIKTEKAGEKKNIAVITLNRPKALNALCDKLVAELGDAVAAFDKDDTIGAVIITGSEKAFAAGQFLSKYKLFRFSSFHIYRIIFNHLYRMIHRR